MFNDVTEVLAMTRLPRTCRTDLSGQVPAAAVDAAMAVSPGGQWHSRPSVALTAALLTVPQTDYPVVEGSKDAESIKDLRSLCRQAIIASADERIAALTRVLEAPDDNPAEMAAARAALARSKAYPKLEEWRPIEEVNTRETYRSVLGGGVLPSEEACVLALYRDLLNGGGPGEAECSTATGEDSTASPECNTSTGEDPVDNEVLRYELEAQKIYKQYILELYMEQFNFISIDSISAKKDKLYLYIKAARTTAQNMEVERARMDCDKSLAVPPAQTVGQDQPENQLPEHTRRRLLELLAFSAMRLNAHASPFYTKAEKLLNLLELIRFRVVASSIIKAHLDQEREISHLLGLTKGALTEGSQMSQRLQRSQRLPDVTEARQPAVKQKIVVYSPENNTEDTQPQNTGQKPEELCATVPELDGIRRAMDPPLSLAEMASAVGRVLRWREQILSISLTRHRAYDYQQWFKDVLHDFRFRPLCEACTSDTFPRHLLDGHWDNGSHACKLAIQNIFVSGSLSEGTEGHVNNNVPHVSEGVEAFVWVSEDGFSMPHWIERGHGQVATGDVASSFYMSKHASDIDFLLDVGPVKWDKGPLRDSGSSNSSEKSQSSDREQVGSETKQHGFDTVHKYNSKRTDSTRADGSDKMLTLHAEQDTDEPGFVNITQTLRREGDSSVASEFTFDYLKLHIAEAMKGHVEDDISASVGPSVEVTFRGDSIDLVPCFQYSERVSDEFVNRERPSGQPNKALVKKLSEMPIYLVGKDGKFRMSFSRLESEVIRSMTKPQRICLVLLKHCAAVTGEGSSMFIEKYMCSYDLKTAMMWVCERRAPELWTWDGMLESMRAVVDFLLERVEQFYLPCYFSPEINLWKRAQQSSIGLEVFRLRSLLPRGIQLLLAGLLSSSQAPLMRHLLNLPLDAQQMLWCCWKRRVDDPYPTGPGSDQKWEIRQQGLCCLLYPAAVEGRLWSEEFLDTFRWESLPARCRQPDWFAEHGWDSDSEGEEENEKDTDREGEEENRKDTDSEGEEENRKDKERERERRRTEKTRREREGEEENRKDKKREG